MTTEEIWRDIPGYEGAYQASTFGRVRSLPGGQRHGKVLKLGKSGRGYPCCAPCIDGKARTRYVHHLVALAFIGPRPEGLDVLHGNGDFTDNRPENLRYGTVSENMRDAIAHGNNFESNRTHCDHGHELTPENTLRHKAGLAPDGQQKYRRRCRECWRLKSHAEYAVISGRRPTKTRKAA